MKQLLIITAFICSFYTVNAQKKSISSKNERVSRSISINSAKLNLTTIKKDMETQNRFYEVTISMAALSKSFKNIFPIAGYALEEEIYWEEGSLGYFRTDGQIKRSKTFDFSNHFEVLIYPNRRDASKVGDVKITWRSKELGLNTFSLENTTAVYHRDGILISGTKVIKGYPMGVTILVSTKK